MKQKNSQIIWWLFRTNFFISAFTFGGGYVVIPMIRKYYVEKGHYFDEEELMEIAAIAQSSPGAIAINMSVLAGYKCAGLKGSIISAIAAICPPLIILSMISLGYQAFRDNHTIAAILNGMQAGVAALIVDVVIGMCQTIYEKESKVMTMLIPFTFLASFLFQINVAIILMVSVLFCMLLEYKQQRKLL